LAQTGHGCDRWRHVHSNLGPMQPITGGSCPVLQHLVDQNRTSRLRAVSKERIGGGDEQFGFDDVLIERNRALGHIIERDRESYQCLLRVVGECVDELRVQ
jgi:hypothetical protein